MPSSSSPTGTSSAPWIRRRSGSGSGRLSWWTPPGCWTGSGAAGRGSRGSPSVRRRDGRGQPPGAHGGGERRHRRRPRASAGFARGYRLRLRAAGRGVARRHRGRHRGPLPRLRCRRRDAGARAPGLDLGGGGGARRRHLLRRRLRGNWPRGPDRQRGLGGPAPRYSAYATSKAAVVRLTECLADELNGRGIAVNAIAPGMVATEIHEATLKAGPDKAGQEHFERTQAVAERGVSMEVPVACVEFLLSPEADGLTGKTIAANFDPWRSEGFRAHLDAIVRSDVYTMRRINPVHLAGGS